jgi:aminopeptidase N
MTDRKYKYHREDFGDLPVTLNHLTMHISFAHGIVEAVNVLDMTARQEMDEITLDAADLDIAVTELVKSPEEPVGSGKELEHSYHRDKNKLVIKLPESVSPGERMLARTVTRCVPSDHILEGIYKDATPPGAPRQYMSQCQQWGFQRIMPIFDDCRAKCTMTTTIEADARYTHLISNGNISRVTNPDGKPIPKPDDPSRQVITYENPIPMAPYLFIICAGTWDELVDHVTYDSGRTVRLEYLVPPGRVEGARIPMEILKESVLWIGRAQDYEYTADTYRTICMTKSNFGGMENVGNTTIVTDAALIDEHTLDYGLIYAHAVIVHEFEHNQCGSETTMDTPFDVWLNEAYTVDVERQFTSTVFDAAFMRLNQVDSIRNPLLGPLAIEDSGRAGKIVREGFNNPDELIDGVTYVKAAEVIRMLRLILGEDVFKAGKTLYFDRYRHSNADTDQFFACFEEVSGVSLEQFKKGWLYTMGYPKVSARSSYDAAKRACTIRFRQKRDEGLEPFHFPIECALVAKDGRSMPGTERVLQMKDDTAQLIIEDVAEEPAFASLNRDYSFYGTFEQEDASPDTLAMQARLETNPFNRVEAFRRLTDIERVKLLNDPDATIYDRWLSVFGELLDEPIASSGLKAFLLRVDLQPMDRKYLAWYREQVAAREKLVLALNGRYRQSLVKHFHDLDTYRVPESPKDGIEDRILKHVLLDLITADDLPESHGLILDHLAASKTNSDRVAGLIALNRSSAPQRKEILEEYYDKWHGHLSGYANYLRVIALGTNSDVFDMIEREKNRPGFDVNQPTWSRALFITMAANSKMVWTDTGIDWVGETVTWLAPINDYSASRLLNTFQHRANLRPGVKEKVTAALERIVHSVSEETSPIVYSQAKAYLGLA